MSTSGVGANIASGQAGVPLLPAVSAVPTISGTAQINQTLTATDATSSNSAVITARQWYDNGVAIPQAIATTFRTSPWHYNHILSYATTLTLNGISTVSMSAGVLIAKPSALASRLALSASTFAINASTGTVIGTIQNNAADTTLQVMDNSDYVRVSGGNLVVGGHARSAAGDFNVALRETRDNGDGTYTSQDTLLKLSGTTSSQPAYHIVALIGQSQMAGRGIRDGALDLDQANVKQFPDIAADSGTYRTIRDSIYPLYHPENHLAVSPQQIGLGPFIGKLLAANVAAGDIILLVPCAWGGTSMVSTAANSAPNAPQWGIGRSLYEGALAQTNAAIAAAKVINPASSFLGTAFAQGETDVDGGIDQATYYAANVNVFNDWRSRITGGSGTPIVMCGVMPEALTATPGYAATDGAHKQVAGGLANVHFYYGVPGHDSGDHLHFDRAGESVNGTRMAKGFTGPCVYFFNVGVSANEGASGTTTLTFKVTRSNGVGAATVPWTFSPGNTSPDDFVGGAYPTGGNISFADTVLDGTFTVSVQGDVNVETNESFTVSITPPAGYVAGDTMSCTGTIVNDDSGGATNLLANPNDVSQWTPGTGVTSASTQNVAVNPVSGLTDMDRLTETATTSIHSATLILDGLSSIVSGQQYTVAVDWLYETRAFVQLNLGSAGAGNSTTYANFDVSTGVVGTKGATATSAIVNLGGGYYRLKMTFTAGGNVASGTGFGNVSMVSSASAARSQSFAGSTSNTGSVGNGQLCTGADATAF